MVLKLQNSLEKSNFIKQLILKAICEIKTNLVDFEQYKLNQQLINDVINFVKSEISKSKYSKDEFDKTEIIKEISNLKQQFTQYGGARPFGVLLMIAGVYDGKPKLYTSEITGNYFEYLTVVGRNSSMLSPNL
jgi:hypothetical protein